MIDFDAVEEEMLQMIDKQIKKLLSGKGGSKKDALILEMLRLRFDFVHNMSLQPQAAGASCHYTVDALCESATKTLHNSMVSTANDNVKDLSIVGNGDMFQLLCKASSQKEGWMKSTKAMEISGCGCLVQVTTQQRNPDGSYSCAEALSFAPGVKIVDDEDDGRKLVPTDCSRCEVLAPPVRSTLKGAGIEDRGEVRPAN